MLTNADLATVFYSAVAVECADDVGGLTFEEFKRVFEVYGDPEVSDLKIDFDTLLAERQPYQR